MSRLLIVVWPTHRQSFENTDKPGTFGYLRPSAAFRDNPDNPEPVTSVEIQRQDNPEADNPVLEDIYINAPLSDAVATFVNDHLGKQSGFDCYDFVNLVGKKPEHKVRDISRHWRIVRCSISDIIPGDVVGFSNKDDLFRHAAVCVAPDLYLSVFGVNGDLEFATFDDLRAPYEIAHVFKMQ